MDASKDIEKITIPATAFILAATLEMPLTRATSSQRIRITIERAIIDTKIGFAKFIPLTETKTNIAAVVKVAPLRPLIPSFSSMSMMMKPITVP